LLINEGNGWLAATSSGFRTANPTQVAELRGILGSDAFWSAPASGGPGCTDAGASLLMMKLPERSEIVRTGTCGETQINEQLVRAALQA
jgi:hypothetical protein